MVRHRQPAPNDGRDVQMQPEPTDASIVVGAKTVAGESARTSTKHAVAPNDYSDWIFGGSFVAAVVLSIRNAVNAIQHGYYESNVKTPTRYQDTDAVRDSNTGKLIESDRSPLDAKHRYATLFSKRSAAFEDLDGELHSGSITLKEHGQKRIAITKHWEGKIAERAAEHGVPIKGWRGYTTGLVEQLRHTGRYARTSILVNSSRDAVISLGALATLKYATHLLKRIDENENDQDILAKKSSNDNAPMSDNDNRPNSLVRDVQHNSRLEAATALGRE